MSSSPTRAACCISMQQLHLGFLDMTSHPQILGLEPQRFRMVSCSACSAYSVKAPCASSLEDRSE